MKNLGNASKIYTSTTEIWRSIERMKSKLNRIISNECIQLSPYKNEKEFEAVFSETDKYVSENFERQHFNRIFWEQQRKYQQLKNAKGMRWHPLLIRFALNLMYMSSSAYRAMRNFFQLPIIL